MTFSAIGFVRAPYSDTAEIPKGLGAKHDMEGVLEILPQFEAGLADIEGFSPNARNRTGCRRLQVKLRVQQCHRHKGGRANAS